MQRYTVYFYLETALHVSSDTSTHHQKRIQLYTSGMEPVFVVFVEAIPLCCGPQFPAEFKETNS
jgi:hypothetical protein